MEQNLSDRERKRRLALGLVVGAVGTIGYLETTNMYLLAGTGLVSLGLMANYVTCFCGTKRVLNGLKDRIEG
jgi:hypothetical protein